PLLHAVRLDGLIAANEGFIDFDDTAARAKRRESAFLHRLADTVRHEPCALEGNAQGAVQLIGADALLARRDQEDCLQPQAQRDMAGLEDGPNLHSKRLATVVALAHAHASALAGQLADALVATAVRAYRAIRPQARFYEFVGRFFVVKVF